MSASLTPVEWSILQTFAEQKRCNFGELASAVVKAFQAHEDVNKALSDKAPAPSLPGAEGPFSAIRQMRAMAASLPDEAREQIHSWIEVVQELTDETASTRRGKERVFKDALSNIEQLSVELRQGGPDPMDLQPLSDALASATEIATEALVWDESEEAHAPRHLGNIEELSAQLKPYLENYHGSDAFNGFVYDHQDAVLAILGNSLSAHLSNPDVENIIGGVIDHEVEPHEDFSQTVCAFFFNEKTEMLKFRVGTAMVAPKSGDVWRFDARIRHSVEMISNGGTGQAWFVAVSDHY